MPSWSRRPDLLLLLMLLAGCHSRDDGPVSRAALRDTLATLFDSVMIIHRAVPDTALLRRLHPPTDTIHFVEAQRVHRFTGDSLRQRVLAMHADVVSIDPRIGSRVVLLLDRDHAMLTGVERVAWVDARGSHNFEGIITIVVQRRGHSWAIRGYHM